MSSRAECVSLLATLSLDPGADPVEVAEFHFIVLAGERIAEGGDVPESTSQAAKHTVARLAGGLARRRVVPLVRAERAVQRQLHQPRMDQQAGRLAHAATSYLREHHVSLATVQVRGLALDQAQLFERAEHSTDRRSRDAKRLAQLALRHHRPGLLHDVEQVESRRRQPKARERPARHAQRPVIGALETEEDDVHRPTLTTLSLSSTSHAD